MSRTGADARMDDDEGDARERAEACARARSAREASTGRLKVNLSTPDHPRELMMMMTTTSTHGAPVMPTEDEDGNDDDCDDVCGDNSLIDIELDDWFDDGDDSGGASTRERFGRRFGWARDDEDEDENVVDSSSRCTRAFNAPMTPMRGENVRVYARKRPLMHREGLLPGAQMDYNFRALERADDCDARTRLGGLRSSSSSRRMGVDVSSSGVPGVANLGNTCYVAASLQLLRSMPTFAADVRSATARVEDSDSRPTLYALREFFDSTGDDPPSVSMIKRLIAVWYPEFEGFEQHDAMEFITALLARIECEMGAENADACPSRLNFSWRSEHRLSCEACGDVSTHDEEQCALSLALRVPDEHNVNINELVERYFTQEKGLSRRCERDGCGGETCTSARSLKTLPRVLLVHLKRFTTEFARNDVIRVGKIRTSVRVPATLTFDDYFGSRSDSDDDHRTPTTAAATRARLRGVVSHLGSAVSSGHFIAHVRDSELDHSQWSMFDDERVSSYVAQNEAMYPPQNSKTPPSASTRSQPFERECYLVAYERQA